MQGEQSDEARKAVVTEDDKPPPNEETGQSFSAASGSLAPSIPHETQALEPTIDEDQEPSESTTTSDAAGFCACDTDLNYFHREATFHEEISSGEFTKVRCLADCCRSSSGDWDGKVELHRWKVNPKSDEQTVVVKRVVSSRVRFNLGKQFNERVSQYGGDQRCAEDCLNEIGVYCYLSRLQDVPQYILSMLTAFESDNDAWLVLSHANDGDIITRMQASKKEGTPLSTSQMISWTWQLLQGVHYLHKHCIGHRDISLENVLLCDGEVRLMDFGQSVRTQSSEGIPLRYFLPLGKPYYRPAECNSPTQRYVDVLVPEGAQAGDVSFDKKRMIEVLLPSSAVPGKLCSAEHWGYTVPPVDVFACGVCLFIMATGGPPWNQASLGDSIFVWVQQEGITELAKRWKKPLPPCADKLLAAMLQSEPSKRLSVEQCLSHQWFDPMRNTVVPVTSASRAKRAEARSSSSTTLSSPRDEPSTTVSKPSFTAKHKFLTAPPPCRRREPRPRLRSLSASSNRARRGAESIGCGTVSTSSEEFAPVGSAFNAVRRKSKLSTIR